MLPPNFRTTTENNRCVNCQAFDVVTHRCNRYKAEVPNTAVCDDWRPVTGKEVSSSPSGAMLHGPGGLLGLPGLGENEKSLSRAKHLLGKHDQRTHGHGKGDGGGGGRARSALQKLASRLRGGKGGEGGKGGGSAPKKGKPSRQQKDHADKITGVAYKRGAGRVGKGGAYSFRMTSNRKNATPSQDLAKQTSLERRLNRQYKKAGFWRWTTPDGHTIKISLPKGRDPLYTEFNVTISPSGSSSKSLGRAKLLSGVATKPGMTGGLHGPSIKNPRVYEALIKQGYSKEQAARISNSMVAAVTKKETQRSNASTHALLPDVVAAQALAFGAEIDPQDLTGSGVETYPHITLVYGVVNDPEAFRQVARIFRPFSVRFGEASLFTNDDFDVLKIDVEDVGDTPGLRTLNRLIQVKMPQLAEGRAIYEPHLTIAYLKPGTGRKYTGRMSLYGKTAVINRIEFTSPDDERTTISLGPEEAGSDTRSHLTVIKQKNGTYRWIGLSSNAFRDRDSEIVSTKALAEDVAYADKTKDYGTLRFWHMPNGIIGECDFNWLYGRTLIESGTFLNPKVAQKVAEKAADYQLSIGFRHPPSEPDSFGVFHHIRRFERSLVPTGLVANPFTKLVVKENHMNDEQKRKAFAALLDGDTETVKAVLDSASASEKQADAMGVAFKSADLATVLSKVDPDLLLEMAISIKESSLEEKDKSEADGQATKARNMDSEGEDDGEDDAMSAAARKMTAMVEKMGGYLDRMEKMVGSREKEASEAAQVAASVTEAKDRLDKLMAEVAATQATLKELTEGQPGDLAEGYRPSGDSTNVVGTQTGEQTKEKASANGFDGLVNFALGGIE